MAEPDLVLLLEARTRDLEKQMARASKVVGTESDRMEKRVRQSATRMERDMSLAARATDRLNASMNRVGRNTFAGLSRGAIGALAPIVSVTAALAGAQKALQAFGDLADKSKSAGLDAEFFQAFAYGAKLSGVELDALSGALNTFAKNSGLAVEGKGRMVTALQALNPELLTSIRSATTQEQRLRLAADAINAAGSASEKAALSAALFGDAGAKMAAMFEGGAAALDSVARKARDLGIIVDRELIARADELGDQFDTATTVLDLEFKQVLVELSPILIGVAQTIGGMAAAVRDLIAAVAESDALQHLTDITAPLQQRAGEIIEDQIAKGKAAIDRMDANRASGEGDQGGWFGTSLGADDARANLAKEVADLEAELKRRSNPANFDVNATFDILAGKPQPPIFPPATTTPQQLPAIGRTGGSGSSGNDVAADAIRQAEAVQQLIGDLEHERSLIGQTSLQQEIANKLREAGAAATDDQRAKITALVTEIDRQRTAIEASESAMETLKGAAKDVLGGMLSDLRSGKSGADALAGALGRVGDRLADMALDTALGAIFDGGQGSGIGTALASLFGGAPKLADGGHVRGPGTGTSDSVPALLSNGEFVVNAAATGRNRALLEAVNTGSVPRFATGGLVGRPAQQQVSAGQAITINAPVTVNANGGDSAQNADLARQTAKAMEQTIRNIADERIFQATRPGNALGRSR